MNARELVNQAEMKLSQAEEVSVPSLTAGNASAVALVGIGYTLCAIARQLETLNATQSTQAR